MIANQLLGSLYTQCFSELIRYLKPYLVPDDLTSSVGSKNTNACKASGTTSGLEKESASRIVSILYSYMDSANKCLTSVWLTGYPNS